MNWWDNLISGATNLGQTATGIIGAVKGTNAPANPATPSGGNPTPAATPATWQKYLPWGIGAAVVVVLLLLIPRGKK